MTVRTASSLDRPPDLADELAAQWQRFAQAGSWWNGEQRVALAKAARAAREGGDEPATSLPPAAASAAARIATSPGSLDREWYRDLLDAGLIPEQVVEMAGVVSILSLGDSLAYALDRPFEPLPEPQRGEPSRDRQTGTDTDASWAPTVRPDSASGFVAEIYRRSSGLTGRVHNVVRALSAVPDELRGFFTVFRYSYDTVRIPRDGDLSRPQMELIAACVSAVNDCFY